MLVPSFNSGIDFDTHLKLYISNKRDPLKCDLHLYRWILANDFLFIQYFAVSSNQCHVEILRLRYQIFWIFFFSCLPSFYVLRILSVFISYMAIYSRKSWNTLCRLPRTKFKANKTKFIDILKQPDEIQTFSLFCVCWLCKMNK